MGEERDRKSRPKRDKRAVDPDGAVSKNRKRGHPKPRARGVGKKTIRKGRPTSLEGGRVSIGQMKLEKGEKCSDVNLGETMAWETSASKTKLGRSKENSATPLETGGTSLVLVAPRCEKKKGG